MKNYIFPFLWMRGEEEHILREEIAKIGMYEAHYQHYAEELRIRR